MALRLFCGVPMQEFVFIIHTIAVISLIGLVLIQHGKGAEMGAAFGSGASNTVFGSAGTISFLAKLTAVIALVFFITSVTLGMLVAKDVKRSSIINSETLTTNEKINRDLLNESGNLNKQDRKNS